MQFEGGKDRETQIVIIIIILRSLCYGNTLVDKSPKFYINPFFNCLR